MIDGGRCRRTFARPAMTFAHSFQKDRLVAAVMDEPWIRDRHKDGKEFVPYALLPVLVVGPKAVLNGTMAGADANANQVVEIAIRQSFDIQIDGCAIEFRVQKVDGVDLVLADGERPQRLMKFLRLASEFPAASTWTKCVRQLVDRENSPAV